MNEVTSDSTLPAGILILDDEPTTVAMLGHVLSNEKWEVFGCKRIAEAEAIVSTASPQVAIVDVFLEGEHGLTFVKSLRHSHSEIGIIVISAEDTESLAKKAIESGADYFLSKPVPPSALILTIRKMLELREQRSRTRELQHELDRSVRETIFPDIISLCDSMKSILALVEKVATRDLSVLVFGESGTGKELVARAIHQHSNRRRGNFVELNCAALPPNLVESELFGHERGSFTGAVATRPGKIEMANGGTLFLDEIGELPLEIQPKLLRALQEKRVSRVGGKNDISCDFRLVTATNRDLLQDVKDGRFREDLFYRVAVFPIKIPPLRDRIEDLDLLLTHFLSQEGLSNPVISAEARAVLANYRWPGNVRELRNFAQAVPLFSENGVIDGNSVRSYFGTRLSEMIGAKPQTASLTSVTSHGLNSRPVRKLSDLEREEVLYSLKHYKGNVSEAAVALGMGRATLYKFIKKHGIELEDYTD